MILCWGLALLIYPVYVSGSAYVGFESDGTLGGVLVNGQTPIISSLTTANASIITVAGFTGIRNKNALVETTLYPNYLNPATLGVHVVICQSEIYYDGNIPRWCRHAELLETYECTQPFDISCDGAVIDRHFVWSWSDDGDQLFKRQAPDDTAMAITASFGIIILAIAESNNGVPTWVKYDAAGWAAITSIVGGADWSACVVHGVAIGSTIALRNTNSPLPVKSLATSLAITVAQSVPAGAVGASANSLLSLILSIVVAGFAGKRGAIWALPWTYINGFYPMVVQAASLDLRESWVAPHVSILLTTTVFLLGFSASDPSLPSWYDYILPQDYRVSYHAVGKRGMVPSGGTSQTGAGN